MHRDDAVRAFETGGPPALARFLARLNSYYPAEHVLTDGSGRDLVTGEDRSDIAPYDKTDVLAAASPPGPARDRPPDRRRPIPAGRPHRPPVRPLGRAPLRQRDPAGDRHASLRPLGPPDPADPRPARHRRPVRTGGPFLKVRFRPQRRDRRPRVRLRPHGRPDRDPALGRAPPPARRLARAEIAPHPARVRRRTRPVRRRPGRGDRPHQSRTRPARHARRRAAAPHPFRVRRPLTRGRNRRARRAPRVARRRLPDRGGGQGLPPRPRRRRAGRRQRRARATAAGVRKRPAQRLRFAPEGTDVDVSLARRHGRAVVTIRDRGPGVPAESLGPIFEPFYRVEPDRSPASGGAGLGLAIARRAVVVYRGQITATNDQPGLRVTIDLPLAPDEAAAADAPPVSPPARLRRPWPTS